ncbi:MAG: hypothetical protein A2V57_00725 [Candidatus Aminicenantes bacterium RBG_19FT_COMBO_65_30]|nr:MAG: hypothetical protein A2V57_00725 [Candidatus Aminicenantes bacterium RBG_19FT_COMBO_65_30]
MPEDLIFSRREIEFLRELARQNVEFMLVGAAAAALQGAPVVTQDVDLWFEDLKDPGIQKALRKSGGIMVPSFGQNPPTFAGDAVKLFDIVLTMHGLESFADEKKNSFCLRLGSACVRVLALDRIIASKEAVRRPKDLLILPVLRDTLKTLGQNKKKRTASRTSRNREE